MPIERRRLTWRGHADGVTLLTYMAGFPSRLPFFRHGTDWVLDLHLPDDARLEYRLEVRRGETLETVLDPANLLVASNPFGHNSVVTGSAYPPPPPDAPGIEWRAVAFRVPSTALGGRRQHRLLSPAGVGDHRPLPLVILHDGTDYLEHASLAAVVGAAVQAGVIPPLRIVLLDPRRRHAEYAADPHHAAHVALELLPHLTRRVAVGTGCVLGGASLGAVAAWHTVHRHPGTFSGLVLQSGTFAFTPHPGLSPEAARAIGGFLVEATASPPERVVAVAQTCGRYEGLLEGNRRVARFLAEGGRLHRYEERWTGHDWGAWRDMLPAALEFVLRAAGIGGPV